MRGSLYTPVLSFGRLSRQSKKATQFLFIINRKRPMKQIKLGLLTTAIAITLLTACSKSNRDYTCVCTTSMGGITTSEKSEVIKADDLSSAKLICTGRSSGYTQCEIK